MNPVSKQHAACDAFISRVFAQPQNPKPCCFKGCSACCSEALYASEAEADFILAGMTAAQKAQAVSRLDDWIAKVRPILPEHMPDAMSYRRLQAPCPLLVDGLCSVYQRRPFGCRQFYALGNPKDCDLPAREHQKFAAFSDDLFRSIGPPVTVNGALVLDHLGVWLAQKILGLKLFSASRQTMNQWEIELATVTGKYEL